MIPLVGTGRIGQIHVESLFARIREVRVVAVANADETKAQDLSAKYSRIKWYRDFSKMLDLDAVLICATTNIHKDIIISAAKKRKHIFCEKPISLTLEETDEALGAGKKWAL